MRRILLKIMVTFTAESYDEANHISRVRICLHASLSPSETVIYSLPMLLDIAAWVGYHYSIMHRERQ